MPRRKPFKDMTDAELTDAEIVRRVFPAKVRKQLQATVSALERDVGKGRKSAKRPKKQP